MATKSERVIIRPPITHGSRATHGGSNFTEHIASIDWSQDGPFYTTRRDVWKARRIGLTRRRKQDQ